MAIEKCKRMLIFAGTSEGHELGRFLKSMRKLDMADFCVATDYGGETLSDIEGISVLSGRLDVPEMIELLYNEEYKLVIDATHPYAGLVSENIAKATRRMNIPLIRLVRQEESAENIITVSSLHEAAEILNECTDGFLLTTGAKELSAFARVRDFCSRAAARVLPSEASLKACADAGLPPSRIICMQGPFTREMNIATMEQYGLSIIVTKSAGKAGGFGNKASLADEGYKVIVIGRPATETGLTLDEVKERLKAVCL